MNALSSTPLFKLGFIVATPGAAEAATPRLSLAVPLPATSPCDWPRTELV